jgi:hypothetical protein
VTIYQPESWWYLNETYVDALKEVNLTSMLLYIRYRTVWYSCKFNWLCVNAKLLSFRFVQDYHVQLYFLQEIKLFDTKDAAFSQNSVTLNPDKTVLSRVSQWRRCRFGLVNRFIGCSLVVTTNDCKVGRTPVWVMMLTSAFVSCLDACLDAVGVRSS